jgi:hypothetical protein
MRDERWDHGSLGRFVVLGSKINNDTTSLYEVLDIGIYGIHVFAGQDQSAVVSPALRGSTLTASYSHYIHTVC